MLLNLKIMNEEDLQDFFISDDGYINLRLKVTTDDKVKREKIVAELMNKTYKAEGFELPENATIDQLYFHNQNPITVLKDIKEKILSDIESIFDESINKQRDNLR
jgi:hypothetical protein